MSLTLGRQGGIAQPLKKRTVGQTNLIFTNILVMLMMISVKSYLI